MKRAELLTASGAVLLVAIQIGAGGVRPWAGGAEWDRIGARAGEVAALEEERRLEQEALRVLEDATGPARDPSPSAAEPPVAWKSGLAALSGEYEWERVEPGGYRLEVIGRFEEVLDLIGLVDSAPGPYVVKRLDLVPERGRVRLTLGLRTAGEGGPE